VQVVEGDLLKLQPAEAAVESGSEVVWPAVGFPFSFHGVLEAALGADRTALQMGSWHYASHLLYLQRKKCKHGPIP
jgi:hypothetical protein